MRHLILPAVVLVGVLAWALTRGGEFDYLGAREDLLTSGPLAVTLDRSEVDARIRPVRWVFLEGGAYLRETPDPGGGDPIRTGFDGREHRHRVLPGCHVLTEAVPPPGAIPGVTVAASLDGIDYSLDRDEASLTYTAAPGGTSLQVSEDLSALSEGGGLAATTRQGDAAPLRWTIRAATPEEVAETRALLGAPVSETATIRLRERAVPTGEIRVVDWVVARDCPEAMITGEVTTGFERPTAALRIGNGTPATVRNAVPLRTEIGALPPSIVADGLEAQSGEVTLREGALFAVGTLSGPVGLAYQVLSCPELPWLDCGPPLSGGPEMIAARDALLAGPVIVDLATEFDDASVRRYAVLPDGRWVVESLVGGSFQILFNGQQTLSRAAEACYREIGTLTLALPDIPGAAFTPSLEAVALPNPTAAATIYSYEATASEGRAVTVTEDLRAIGAGILSATADSSTGLQRFTIRAASPTEQEQAETILGTARASEVTSLRLRYRLLDGTSDISPSSVGFVVLRDCPGYLLPPESGGFAVEKLPLTGDPVAIVEHVVPLDLPLETPIDDLRAAAETGIPADLPLRPGLVFATADRAVEVVSCEPREWFRCGPQPEPPQ